MEQPIDSHHYDGEVERINAKYKAENDHWLEIFKQEREDIEEHYLKEEETDKRWAAIPEGVVPEDEETNETLLRLLSEPRDGTTAGLSRTMHCRERAWGLKLLQQKVMQKHNEIQAARQCELDYLNDPMMLCLNENDKPLSINEPIEASGGSTEQSRAEPIEASEGSTEQARGLACVCVCACVCEGLQSKPIGG